MAKVLLAYHNSDLSDDLTIATVKANATAWKEFKPIEFYTPEKEHIVHEPAVTGRGRIVQHILHSHKKYPMKIEPREFLEDTTKLPFLRNLWDADFIYFTWYDYDASPAGYNNFVEVTRGDNKFPIGYEKNLVWLPVVTFNFTGTEAV